MEFSKRLILLKALGGKGSYETIEGTVAILTVLRKYGYLHLSDLVKTLEKEENIPRSISSIHKYVVLMEEKGIVNIETAANRKYVSILDVELVDWLFIGISREEETSEVLKNILFYTQILKKKWDNIIVLSKNEVQSFREYAPSIVSKLIFTGIEPYKHILVLNSVAKELPQRTSSYEVENNVLRILSQLDKESYEKYRDLLSDEVTLGKIDDILKQYMPDRGFTAPSLEKLAILLSEIESRESSEDKDGL